MNTYWIRLPLCGQTFAGAVENAARLFRAAREAGVGRIVHVSVSNPEAGANLAYYAGKAEMERRLAGTGVPHAILRPTLVVSERDVLTANIAWLLRRLPVFLLPQGGRARLQPIVLRDAAQRIADAVEETDTSTRDLAGPEVFSFRAYVETIGEALGVRRLLLPAPNGVALAATGLLGRLLGDVLLSREELLGLEQELLCSREPPLGRRSVRAYLREIGPRLGRRYRNDRRRHLGDQRHRPLS